MDSPALDESLRAHVCVAYLRSRRVVALHWLAILSVPLWCQGLAGMLPATIAWILGLFTAMLAALSVAYGVLEVRWNRRAGPAGMRSFGSTRGVSLREDVDSGWLCAWGVLALAPTAAALGSSLATRLLPALSPVTLAALAARVLLEAINGRRIARAGPAGRPRAWAGRFGVR